MQYFARSRDNLGSVAKRPPNRFNQVRSAVAQEAARLMSEHGIQDYFVAKRKAAERYGVVEGVFLPKNTEIEAALLERQRLFGGAQHASTLHEQRRMALTAMQLLEKFEPRLVGAVLNGSATGYTNIQLHVFSDSVEDVCLHLFDHRYDYEVLERKVRMSPERQMLIPTVRFDLNTETVEAFVFPRDGIRQAPTSPVDGKPMRRADIADVTGLTEGAALPP